MSLARSVKGTSSRGCQKQGVHICLSSGRKYYGKTKSFITVNYGLLRILQSFIMESTVLLQAEFVTLGKKTSQFGPKKLLLWKISQNWDLFIKDIRNITNILGISHYRILRKIYGLRLSSPSKSNNCSSIATRWKVHKPNR